jgi:hypothetical protein
MDTCDMTISELREMALKVALSNMEAAKRIIEIYKGTIATQAAQIKMLKEMLDMEKQISRLKNG